MSRQLTALALALAWGILPTVAQAKILFLNLNFAPEEVAAVRAEALARHEQVVLIPDLSGVSNTQLTHLAQSKREYTDRRERISAEIERTGKAKSDPRMDALAEEFKVYSIDMKGIEQALRANPDATSFIVSGHSSGAYYEGVLGSLDVSELLDVLSRTPVAASLRSVYLWGCYSASPAALESWKKTLPNGEYLIGFSGRSDLAESGQGALKLRRALAAEASLRKEINARKELAALGRIEGPKARHHVAGLIGSNYVSTQNSYAGPIVDIRLKCPDLLRDVLISSNLEYDPYAEGARSLPADSDATPIRRFYQKLQDSSHCIAQCQSDPAIVQNPEEFLKSIGLTTLSYNEYTGIPCPGKVIGLIKFEHVVNNYKRRYRSEFEFYKQILATEDGVTPECRKLLTGDFSPSDRPLIHKSIRRICVDESKFKDAKIAAVAASSIDRVWTLLNDVNIPFSWIDEQPDPEAPRVNGQLLRDENVTPIVALPK